MNSDTEKRKHAEQYPSASAARLVVDLPAMQRLYDLHARLANETDLTAALREILAASCEFTGTTRGCVQLLSDDGERLEMVAHQGYPPNSPFTEHFRFQGALPACDAVRRQEQRLIIEDVEAFPLLAGTRDLEVARADGIRATQSTPMISRHGELVGVLNNQFPQPHRPSEDELRLIDLLAWTAADFVARHHADLALRESEERQAFLLRLSDAVRPLADPVAIQEEVCHLLRTRLAADRVFYADVSEDGWANIAVDSRAESVPSVVGKHRMADFGQCLITSLLTGGAAVCEDVDALPLASAEREAYRALAVAAKVKVPLVKGPKRASQEEGPAAPSHEGERRLVAFLGVHQARRRAWTRAEVALIEETAERTWAAVERARTEEALRASEAQFRSFVAATSDTVYKMSADWSEMRLLEGKQFLADTQDPSRIWLEKYIPAEEQTRVQAAIQAAVRDKRPFELEHRVIRADGTVGWTSSRAIPLLDAQGDISEWIGAASDVTGRKHAEEVLRASEERQAFLLSLSDALRSLPDPRTIAATAACLLGEHLGVDRVFITEVEPDGMTLHVRDECLRAGASSMLGDYRFDQFGAFVGRELRQGNLLAVEDVSARDDLDADERATYAQVGVAACLLIPLIRDGRLAAYFTLNHRTPRAWTEADRAVARQTADRTWMATERARTEAALRDSETRLGAVFDASPAGLVLADASGRVLRMNDALARIWGPPPTPSSTAGYAAWKARWAESGEPLAAEDFAMARTLRTGEVVPGDLIEIERFDGGRATIINVAAPIRDAAGTVVGGIVAEVDVTAQWEAERALRESEARTRALAENMPGGAAFIFDQQLRYVLADGEAMRAAGFQSADFLGKTSAEAMGEALAATYTPFLRGALAGEPFVHEHTSHGATFVSRGAPLREGANGEITGVVVISYDITERKRAEAALRAALDEREALLKELHHRVKNNLQVVTSLLEMQARRVNDPTAVAALAESRHRITSIAAIHELLYQEGTFSQVELGTYARELVPRLVSFYRAQDRIKTAVGGEEVLVDLECAVPCGLLLNELVSNACKHAFPSPNAGTLTITLAQDETTIRLGVRDDGVGLPAGFEPQKSPTLGLQLVGLLAKQLGGSVVFGPGGGTHAEVRIPRGAGGHCG